MQNSKDINKFCIIRGGGYYNSMKRGMEILGRIKSCLKARMIGFRVVRGKTNDKE